MCDEEKIHCELLHGVEDNGGLIQQTESHVDQFVILEAIDENQQLQLEKKHILREPRLYIKCKQGICLEPYRACDTKNIFFL